MQVSNATPAFVLMPANPLLGGSVLITYEMLLLGGRARSSPLRASL